MDITQGGTPSTTQNQTNSANGGSSNQNGRAVATVARPNEIGSNRAIQNGAGQNGVNQNGGGHSRTADHRIVEATNSNVENSLARERRESNARFIARLRNEYAIMDPIERARDERIQAMIREATARGYGRGDWEGSLTQQQRPWL